MATKPDNGIVWEQERYLVIGTSRNSGKPVAMEVLAFSWEDAENICKDILINPTALFRLI
jgi:hypothetical protein